MSHDLYVSVELDHCRRAGHNFRIVGSEKTPLKASLVCVTCSDASHKTAFVAYGQEADSWGNVVAPRNHGAV